MNIYLITPLICASFVCKKISTYVKNTDGNIYLIWCCGLLHEIAKFFHVDDEIMQLNCYDKSN